MRKTLTIIGKIVLGLLSVAGSAVLVITVWLVWHYEYGIGLPSESKLATLAATGPACSVRDPGVYTPLTEVPPMIRNAVLAVEDPDFYKRPLLSPLAGLALAAIHNRRPPWSNISSSVTQGCLMALSPGCCRGLDWHVGNLVLMGRIERTLSRDRILEIYLNETYLGRGTYGAAAAATSYFGKSLTELEIDEAAFIAALPRAPSVLSRRKDLGIERRNGAIDRMVWTGAISEVLGSSAKERPLQLREEPPKDHGR